MIARTKVEIESARRIVRATYLTGWASVDIKNCLTEVISILDNVSAPHFYLTDALAAPQPGWAIMTGVRGLKAEIDRLFSHPNLIKPTVMAANSFVRTMGGAAIRVRLAKPEDLIIVPTIEECERIISQQENARVV